jgi:hypothetical protein
MRQALTNWLIVAAGTVFIGMGAMPAAQDHARAQSGGLLGRIGQRVREAVDPMIVRGYIRTDMTVNGPTAYCLQNRRTGEKPKQAMYGRPVQRDGASIFEAAGPAPFDCDLAEANGLLLADSAGAPSADNPAPGPNALRFEDVTITDLRLGMDEQAALQQIRKVSPGLKVVTHWLTINNNTGSLYNGALGAPLPEGADPRSAPGGPYVKIGVSVETPPEQLPCVTSLRPGYPGTTAAQQNRICERIWLQTTPAAEGASIVAMSRVLVFGGNTKPSLQALADDLVKKYGRPSGTPAVARMPSGDTYPTSLVWEFDRNGRIVAPSQARPVDDGAVEFGVPVPYVARGGAPGVPTINYSGRTIVIGAFGPEFTGGVTDANPRLLSATITPDAAQPLLAARLSVVVYDPVMVVRNRAARIEAHNKLVDMINAAKEGKAREDADQASKRARPPL